MKKIKIEVTIEVPDDFRKEEPEWDVEDAVRNHRYGWYATYCE